MNARSIINSRFGVETALWAGRILSPKVGHAFAGLVADQISRRKNLDPVRALRANQYVVHGMQVGSEELDRLVRDAYRCAARCIFDFYHWMDDEQALLSRVIVEPSFEEIIQKSIHAECGTLLAMPHIANFDLVGRAIIKHGLQFQAITPPTPPGGYQLQNKLRSEAGMVVTPASYEAVRSAAQRLRAGGCVITGADRPIAGSPIQPRFFGLPASVPLVHIRLGLRLNLPVSVIGIGQDRNGIYHIWASSPVELAHFSDPGEEVLANAEVVLKSIAQNIRDYAVQWNMTYPVWPQVLNEVPQ